MPVYVIEFVTSDERPQQRRFTLDDDRPLRPQVEHVLAELERAGLVLRGGPADELTVRWAGQEVDAARSPAALGVTPDRPVELRMQRRRAPIAIAPPPPPPEAPTTRFVPRSVYASATLGAAGGWAAWTAAGVVADGGPDGTGLFGTHAGLNGWFAACIGALVGAAVGTGAARRANGSTVAGAARGAAGGFVGALVWAVLASFAFDRDAARSASAANTAMGAILGRAAGWALLGGLVALGVSLTSVGSGPSGARVRAAARAAGWGVLAGATAGLVPALPGPVELWSALAAATVGAGVGASVVWGAVRRAVGVITLEARRDHGPGVFSLREWLLGEGSAVAVADGRSADAPIVSVAGTTVTQARADGGAPRRVRQDDRLTVGDARFRFRRLVAPALAVACLGAPARSTSAQAAPAPTGVAGDASPRDASQTAGPIDRVALVRCVAGRPLPCVQVRVTLPPDAAVRDALAAGASGADDADTTAAPARATGWSGRLGPYALDAVQVRVARAGGPRRVVLTLIDVSGSMRGDGMQVARAAVRAFLRDLGVGAAPGAVQAALGAFASRNVVAGVRGVAFAAPETVAGNVDLLPAPGGNTGLYSAVAAGAERAADAAREAGEGTRPVLVVITDGVNDVTDAAGRPRANDDPGLLRGPEGRASAAATARRLGVDLYLLGVGQEPDMNELQALAGDPTHAFRTARDAIALRAALTRVDAALAPTRDVLFAVPGAERASLARPEWQLRVARDTPGTGSPAARSARGVSAEFAGMWPAPLVGFPVFDGAAFRSDERGPAAPAWLRTAAGDAPAVDRRALVALFVALLVAIVWALPRALWRPALVPAVGSAPGAAGGSVTDAPVRHLPLRPAPAASMAAAASGVTGFAPDVREAPPRRPEDVTAQRVRRTGTRPASSTIAANPATPRRP